jgi:hypothetical protein
VTQNPAQIAEAGRPEIVVVGRPVIVVVGRPEIVVVGRPEIAEVGRPVNVVAGLPEIAVDAPAVSAGAGLPEIVVNIRLTTVAAILPTSVAPGRPVNSAVDPPGTVRGNPSPENRLVDTRLPESPLQENRPRVQPKRVSRRLTGRVSIRNAGRGRHPMSRVVRFV